MAKMQLSFPVGGGAYPPSARGTETLHQVSEIRALRSQMSDMQKRVAMVMAAAGVSDKVAGAPMYQGAGAAHSTAPVSPTKFDSWPTMKPEGPDKKSAMQIIREQRRSKAQVSKVLANIHRFQNIGLAGYMMMDAFSGTGDRNVMQNLGQLGFAGSNVGFQAAQSISQKGGVLNRRMRLAGISRSNTLRLGGFAGQVSARIGAYGMIAQALGSFQDMGEDQIASDVRAGTQMEGGYGYLNKTGVSFGKGLAAHLPNWVTSSILWLTGSGWTKYEGNSVNVLAQQKVDRRRKIAATIALNPRLFMAATGETSDAMDMAIATNDPELIAYASDQMAHRYEMASDGRMMQLQEEIKTHVQMSRAQAETLVKKVTLRERNRTLREMMN